MAEEPVPRGGHLSAAAFLAKVEGGSCRAVVKRRRVVTETTFAKRTLYPGKLIGGGWEPTHASVKILGIARAMVGVSSSPLRNNKKLGTKTFLPVDIHPNG